MASRTIAFATYTTDGALNTATAPTVTVSYNGAAATALTPTANGSLWNVTVDDTQDATLLISGSGLTTDHLIVLRRDLPVAPTASATATAVRSELGTELGRIDAAISSRLAYAAYTAPPADYATASAVAAIPTNPLLVTDTRIDNLDATVSSRLATSGYTAPSNATIAAIDSKVDALNDISAADVAGELVAYGTAKTTDIPTDYALESTSQSTLTAVSALNDFDPATDTVETVRTVLDPVTASVDTSAIPAAVWSHSTRTLTSAGAGGATAQEVWEYAERTLSDDIPTITADLLGERHGTGLWGAADPSWPAITAATLDDSGVPLGPLDSADVLIVAQADGSSYGTRSDADGDFELRVPAGATYTLQALRPGFAYPIRRVTV